jgi:glycosyltransferase involved in cell wall biosynthesis
MMLKRRNGREELAISVIWQRAAVIGACQYLRLTAPFSWLTRHEGWAPLEYALKHPGPGPRQRRWLARADRLCFGSLSRTSWGHATLAHAREPLLVSPSPSADALLVYREEAPECVAEAIRLARQRQLPLVYDTDDLLLAVPNDSPLADRYAAARPLLTRWIREADHVTVASAALAAELSALNPSVFILPNAIDVRLWGVSGVRSPDDHPVRVGFWGSATHLPDLQQLTRGLRHLKSRWGNRVSFQFMGCCDPALLSLGSVTATGYMDSYAAYASATRRCPLDIAIAPLAANRFNRCKSPIKFFEYSIRGACGVYADLEPYQDVVRQGENGLLVGSDPDDWVSALEQLIRDPALRHRMARRAHADVLARHTLDHLAVQWRDAYRTMTGRSDDRKAAGTSERRFTFSS